MFGFITRVDEVVWPLVLKQRLETTRLSLKRSLFCMPNQTKTLGYIPIDQEPYLRYLS